MRHGYDSDDLRSITRVALGCMAMGVIAMGCASTLPPRAELRPAIAPPPAPPPPTAAERLAAEFAWSSQPGSNTVNGRVAYRGAGAAWTCAGQSVALAPETRTSREHMLALYGSDEAAMQPVSVVRARGSAATGADFGAWVRTTTCDLHNAFAFHALPDGGFYLIARAHPRSHKSEQPDLVFMQRIRVRGGAAADVSLPAPQRPG